jgi:hypothetical protein
MRRVEGEGREGESRRRVGREHNRDALVRELPQNGINPLISRRRNTIK